MARGPIHISLADLRQQCALWPCAVPEESLAPLASYLELLTQWNRAMNLVGTHRWHDTLHTLVADSFYLAEFLCALPLPETPHTWDLGAGAGLPGIPLRTVWTKGRYFLVEAREKRSLFLSTVLAHVALPATEVFCGRAEDFFMHAPGAAHVVVSRAFMPWAKVLDMVRPHVQQPEAAASGRVVFLALHEAPAEPPQGWMVEASHRYTVGKDVRHLWCLRLVDSMQGTGSVC